jgi:hypothetical protein
VTRRAVTILILVGVGLAALTGTACRKPRPPAKTEAEIRQALFDALRPVKVTNCQFARFGEPHDGGYLVCGNLLDAITSGYSYGINGFDGWGCDVSTKLKVPVHEYDCFNTSKPECSADARFHPECVGPKAETLEGRIFDSLANQIDKNGDKGKRLIVKMDVEGAEWESFLSTPDAVFADIDQLIVEFHQTNDDRYLKTVETLKRSFYVAHLHFNNHACEAGLEPFPAWAYEVLFVNKRIAQIDPSAPAEGPDALDAPNATSVPDCQTLSQ